MSGKQIVLIGVAIIAIIVIYAMLYIIDPFSRAKDSIGNSDYPAALINLILSFAIVGVPIFVIVVIALIIWKRG
jgi:hypothetical protein